MDPLPILPWVDTAAADLHAIYAHAKANKKQCSTLDERVQTILLPWVRRLGWQLRKKRARWTKGQHQTTEDEIKSEHALALLLQRLERTLGAAVALVTKFSQKNWLSRIIGKADYTRDFADLNADLITLSGDLQLSVICGGRDEANARQANLQQLIAGLHEVLARQATLQYQIGGIHGGTHMLVQAQQDSAEHHDRQSSAEITGGPALAQQQLTAAHNAAITTNSSSPVLRSLPPRPAAHVISIPLDDLALDAEPVGIGGFGDVYRAEWKSRDAIVAAKKLTSLSSTAIAEFEAEVQLMANVPRHDHVIGLLGVCRDQATDYLIVMDWMDRGSLSRLLHQQANSAALGLYDRLALMLQCAKALNHLHLLRPPAGPIIHGDVNSTNFLIDRHGDVKIGQAPGHAVDGRLGCISLKLGTHCSPCFILLAVAGDFSLARIRRESMTQAQTRSHSIGSMHYLAPEKMDLMEDPNVVATPASDVYSLAIVLWEVLTDQTPWASVASPVRIQLAVLNGKRPTIPPATKEKVRSIIEQAWHTDPNQRPTCQQLIQSIKAVMQEVSPHLPSPTSVALTSTISPSPLVSVSSPPTEESVSSPSVSTLAESWGRSNEEF